MDVFCKSPSMITATDTANPGFDRTVSDFESSDCHSNNEALDAYKRDGVVCLRRAFEQDWLNVIEQGIQQAISGASTDVDIVNKPGDKGSFSISSQAWQQVEAFRHFIFDSHLADLAWPLLESKTLNLFYDFLLIKQANSNNAVTPWHQDHSFYPLSGTKVINCWIALDHIPVETSLRFYAGSHISERLHRAVNFEDTGKEYRHARMERPAVPDIDSMADAEILATGMHPGDMLIWNSHTFHCAPGNKLDRRRAAFSVNWVGDDVTYEEVPALETYLNPELKTGDRITSRKFPLVRSCENVFAKVTPTGRRDKSK